MLRNLFIRLRTLSANVEATPKFPQPRDDTVER